MLHILRLQLEERASIYDFYARILFSTKFGENHEFQTLKNIQLRVLSRHFLVVWNCPQNHMTELRRADAQS